MKQKAPPTDYRQLLALRRYDPNIEPPPERAVLTIDGNIIGNNQNIVTIQAKQKQGKTTYLTAIIASALTGDPVFRMQVHLQRGKQRVAYFDTEQGRGDFYKTIKKIKQLSTLQTFPGHFDAFNMREDDPEDIIGAIGEYMSIYPDCGLLVVDNSTDLLNSFNDEAESKTKIQHFKRWTKQGNNLAIQALHTGRSGENTLGHFGAFSDRASQSVLHIEKTERGTVTCKPRYLRSSEDFDPIEIAYNRDIHNWEETFYVDVEKSTGRVARATPGDIDDLSHRSKLSFVFNAEGIIIDYKVLVNGICEVYNMPQQWAKECVKYLIMSQIVFKIETGYTMQRQTRLFIEK